MTIYTVSGECCCGCRPLYIAVRGTFDIPTQTYIWDVAEQLNGIAIRKYDYRDSAWYHGITWLSYKSTVTEYGMGGTQGTPRLPFDSTSQTNPKSPVTITTGNHPDDPNLSVLRATGIVTWRHPYADTQPSQISMFGDPFYLVFTLGCKNSTWEIDWQQNVPGVPLNIEQYWNYYMSQFALSKTVLAVGQASEYQY